MKNFFKYSLWVIGSWIFIIFVVKKALIFLFFLVIKICAGSLPAYGLTIYAPGAYENTPETAETSSGKIIVSDYHNKSNPEAITNLYIYPLMGGYEVSFETTLNNTQMDITFYFYETNGLFIRHAQGITVHYKSLNNSKLSISEKDAITKIAFEDLHTLFLDDAYKYNDLNDNFWGFGEVNEKQLEKYVYKYNKIYNTIEFGNSTINMY